jgi:hypothetical protein
MTRGETLFNQHEGMTMIFGVGEYVRGSQYNGIQWFGQVVGHVYWNDVTADKPDHIVVRYYWDPSGDPPRKPYRLVDLSEEKVEFWEDVGEIEEFVT